MTEKEDWQYRIAKLHLEEGDILVIKSDRAPQYDWWMPLNMKGVRILYIPTDVDLSVLTRAEIEAKTVDVEKT